MNDYINNQLAAHKIPSKGFGFGSGDSMRFYTVHCEGGDATIYEATFKGNSCRLSIDPVAKIDGDIWAEISPSLATSFNDALEKRGQKKGKFRKGHTPLAEHFGHQILPLVWVLEDLRAADIDKVWVALVKWEALAPEEAWWLFLKASADPSWKAAVKVALA
ncbi:DUF3780 domain-containing protein [Massilia sp. NP310]|uniref:DUF3780 domain-containing protein n=1 Tax=Massilia sp. NP310 TaxID=2861282 RepID=UPI001C636212|nr:DUF3780 domain-containing protein [Massilia sp. NP310]QYG04037.1 DUF3780 domain-containing protein [Massilia sp. NP310]